MDSEADKWLNELVGVRRTVSEGVMLCDWVENMSRDIDNVSCDIEDVSRDMLKSED